MTSTTHDSEFRIERHGSIYVVTLDCAQDEEKLTGSLVETIVHALRERVEQDALTQTGWSVLYDFSTLRSIDSASLRAMAQFYLWAKDHGRQRIAHIFPSGRNTEKFELLRQAVAGLIDAYGKTAIDGERSHAVSTIQEGLDYLRQPVAATSDEATPRYGANYPRHRWSDSYRP